MDERAANEVTNAAASVGPDIADVDAYLADVVGTERVNPHLAECRK